jgi:hypothetical protein
MLVNEDPAVVLPGRSPVQIQDDLAQHQELIRRARESAEGLDVDSAQYRGAVDRLAQACRRLVDYEARIPRHQEAYRLWLRVLLARRAALALMVFCAVLALTAWPRWIGYGWLVPLIGMGLSASWVRLDAQGNATATLRDAARGFRPEIGAPLFALAAVAVLLGAVGLVTAWLTLPLALLATWAGMVMFGIGEVTPGGWGR